MAFSVHFRVDGQVIWSLSLIPFSFFHCKSVSTYLRLWYLYDGRPSKQSTKSSPNWHFRLWKYLTHLNVDIVSVRVSLLFDLGDFTWYVRLLGHVEQSSTAKLVMWATGNSSIDARVWVCVCTVVINSKNKKVIYFGFIIQFSVSFICFNKKDEAKVMWIYIGMDDDEAVVAMVTPFDIFL